MRTMDPCVGFMNPTSLYEEARSLKEPIMMGSDGW